MNPVEGVFHDFVQLFERLNVSYAVMGGLAVRAHGIPRPTLRRRSDDSSRPRQTEGCDRRDPAPRLRRSRSIRQRLGRQCLRPPFIKAVTYIEGRSLVADIFLAETDFLRSLISRRIRDQVNGFKAWLVTAEDLILLKLIANRPRDIADIADVLIMQLHLDDEYLRHWANILGIRDKLDAMR